MVHALFAYDESAYARKRLRLPFVGLLTLLALIALATFAGAAQATVTGVTADNSSVSQAAGARTVYKVGFTAHATLTTTSQSTGTITITFPNGTDITQIQTFDIRDGATQVGNFCSHTAAGVNPPVLTCNIFNGSTVAPGDTVAITLNEVTNPAPALPNPSLSVSTSAESTPVNSPASASYQVVGQNPITNVTVDNDTVTQAAGARTVYHVGFKTSITGGLAGAAGSQFTITFPNGTDITQIQTFDIRDGATQVGNFCSHTAAGVNPPVLTCARTVYHVGFKTSITGGLAGAAGSQFTITFPNGTDITQIQTFDIRDGATQVGNFCSHTAAGVNPPVLTCNIFNSATGVVHPGDTITTTLNEVTNPTTTAANPTVTVATTSDTAPVSSPNTGNTRYQIVGQNPITNVTVDNDTVTQAAGARTVYHVGFKTSITGGLAGAAGSQFTITFPNGTDITQIQTFDIRDGATQVGNFCSHTAAGVNPPVLTCNIFNSATGVVHPGDTITTTLNEVTNPTTTAANPTVTVATTSDTAPVSSPNTGNTRYQIVGQNPITNVTVDNDTVTQAAGARTVYHVGFKTSITGGLAGAAGSQFTITFPNGTDITQIQTFDIRDGATQVGNFCSHTAAGVNPPVLTCNIFNSATGVVHPGDTITTTLNEVTNPTTTAANPTVTVATTSDTAPVSSPNTGNTRYQIAAGHQVTAASAALSNQAPSAAGVVYTIGFTTSATGGLAGTAGSQINIALANGTDLTHITSFNITDTSTNQQVGNFCSHTAAGVNPPVLTCNIFNSATGTVGPGQGVRVQINGITNPATAASGTASISTTSDLPQVGANYNIGGNPPPPTVTSISPTSGPAGGGTMVAINGANFTGSTVMFGSAPATITGNTGTQLTVLSPPGSGTVDVIVTNAGGSSTASAADQFTYIAPTQPPPPSPPPPAPSAPAVTGGAPTNQTSSGASVAGSVNPEGVATQAFFQYGIDLSQRGPGASTTLYDQQTPPQQVGSDAAAHTVSASLNGLVPGALYHIRLVATNSAGTTFGPDQTFSTPAAPAPPPPVLGKSENAQPVSGIVFIRNATGQFIPLTGATQIPSGAVIDALHGTLKITTALPGAGGARDAAAKGKKPQPKTQTQSGNFGGAIFKITQAGNGLANLSLVEGAFSGAPSYATCKAHKAGDASAAAVSSKTLQLLHASAHGKFRTTGRYSAATVRGTVWTVADRCDGTLTHVVTDSVAVSDFVRHKTIILHVGQSYLAKAPK